MSWRILLKKTIVQLLKGNEWCRPCSLLTTSINPSIISLLTDDVTILVEEVFSKLLVAVAVISILKFPI